MRGCVFIQLFRAKIIVHLGSIKPICHEMAIRIPEIIKHEIELRDVLVEGRVGQIHTVRQVK